MIKLAARHLSSLPMPSAGLPFPLFYPCLSPFKSYFLPFLFSPFPFPHFFLSFHRVSRSPDCPPVYWRMTLNFGSSKCWDHHAGFDAELVMEAGLHAC